MRKFYRGRKIKQQLRSQNSLRIVFGASGKYEEGWIPTDIDNLNLLEEADWKKYFEPASIDAMLAEHVWEHLTLADGITAARYCYKYLKHGAYLRLAVPDGNHPDPAYIDYVKVNGSGPGSDDHKVLYTYETLRNMLESVGFTVRPLEYFDAEGEFHYVDWNADEGKIYRSKRFDRRNEDGSLSYTSIILDAYKP